MKQLVDGRVVKGEVVALDGTAIKAYSQRSLDNKSRKSDCEARVGRGRRLITVHDTSEAGKRKNRSGCGLSAVQPRRVDLWFQS